MILKNDIENSKFNNAVAYLRVSSDRQAKENTSLDTQLTHITEFCKEHNLNLIKEYRDEGYSGYQGVRPSFGQMLYDIENNIIETNFIIVFDQSRIARNELTRLEADSLLKKKGVKLITTSDGIPTDSDSTDFMRSIFGAFNENFSRTQSKNSVIRLYETAKKGYFTGGVPPFGYTSVIDPTSGAKKKKLLAILPEEAEVVKLIFKLASEGTNGVRMGLKKIASHLNRLFIHKRGKKWSTNDIHRILTDTMYMGQRVYGKQRIRKDIDLETIIVKTPIIITDDLFFSVQKGLKRNNLKNNEHHKNSSPSLLAGILKCPYCECGFQIATGKSGRYKYYKCTNSIKKDSKACKNNPLPKEETEKIIIEKILDQVLTVDFIIKTLDELNSEIKENQKDNQMKLLNKKHSLSSFKKKYKHLIDLIADEKFALDETTTEHIRHYQSKISQIQKDIEHYSEQINLPIKKFSPKHAESFCDACRDLILESSEENDPTLKALLMASIREVEVFEKKKIKILGNRFKLLHMVSTHVIGTKKIVPNHISIWR